MENGRKEGGSEKLLKMTTNITTEISNSKKNYFDNSAEKLCHPKLNRKAYWSVSNLLPIEKSSNYTFSFHK